MKDAFKMLNVLKASFKALACGAGHWRRQDRVKDVGRRRQGVVRWSQVRWLPVQADLVRVAIGAASA